MDAAGLLFKETAEAAGKIRTDTAAGKRERTGWYRLEFRVYAAICGARPPKGGTPLLCTDVNLRNVRVNNCLFIGTDLGLRFKSTRGRGGVVEKICISNVCMTDILTDAIGFNLYYSNQAPGEGGGGAAAAPNPCR